MRDASAKAAKAAADYPPFALDVHAAEHYTSVGRTVIYEAVRKKKLRMHRLGGKTLFLRTDLEAWMLAELVESMPMPKGGAIKRMEMAAPGASGRSQTP